MIPSRLGRPILLVTAIAILGGTAAPFSTARSEDGDGVHSSNLLAVITMPNGSNRTVTVQGVGCNISLCSRVAVRSRAEMSARLTSFGIHKEIRTWLDSLVAIKEITGRDALFVFKDGSAQRLSIIDGNRFLYFANSIFGHGKIDVTKVRSVEFLSNSTGAGSRSALW